MIVLDNGYDNLDDVINGVKGISILIFGIDEYECNELSKILNYISVDIIKLKSLRDVTFYDNYDVIVIDSKSSSLGDIINNIRDYNIDNKKIMLINHSRYFDYELINLFGCEVINYPINYIDFIKLLYRITI